jgi:hypothetical protein
MTVDETSCGKPPAATPPRGGEAAESASQRDAAEPPGLGGRGRPPARPGGTGWVLGSRKATKWEPEAVKAAGAAAAAAAANSCVTGCARSLYCGGGGGYKSGSGGFRDCSWNDVTALRSCSLIECSLRGPV